MVEVSLASLGLSQAIPAVQLCKQSPQATAAPAAEHQVNMAVAWHAAPPGLSEPGVPACSRVALAQCTTEQHMPEGPKVQRWVCACLSMTPNL